MAIQYTFDNKANYLQANIKSSTATETFTTKSFGVDKKHLDYTTVETSDGSKGVIHWKLKEEVIQVNGKDYIVEEVRKQETGIGNLYKRAWSIEGNEWRTFYDVPNKTWKVYSIHSATPEDQPVITFHEYESHVFSGSESALLSVEHSVSKDDLLVLILIVLCSHYTQLRGRGVQPGEALAWGIIAGLGFQGF